jgi:hypothetical protein
MTSVKPGQEWELKRDGDWKRARVVNVLGPRVELHLVDRPDLSGVIYTDLVQMERDPPSYRLVKDVP